MTKTCRAKKKRRRPKRIDVVGGMVVLSRAPEEADTPCGVGAGEDEDGSNLNAGGGRVEKEPDDGGGGGGTSRISGGGENGGGGGGGGVGGEVVTRP